MALPIPNDSSDLVFFSKFPPWLGLVLAMLLTLLVL